MQALHPDCLRPSSVPHPRVNDFLCRRSQSSSLDLGHTRRSSPQVRACSTAVSQSQYAGLLLSLGATGSWDDAAVGRPIVRCYLGDSEQRWFLWYSGRGTNDTDADCVQPSSGSVGLAVSSNGVDWARGSGDVEGSSGPERAQEVGRVLKPNPDWWCFDTAHVTVSDVQIMSNSSVNTGVGVWWMFYSGGSFEETAAPAGLPGAKQGIELAGLRQRPGLAMSQDGRNWARVEGEHHTGAFFDVGEEGEWDEHFVATPQVLNAGPGDMRMFYHSFDASRQLLCVGLATSPDAFKWQKQGPIFVGTGQPDGFDSRGVASSNIVKDFDNKQFVMFYEGVDDANRRSIGIAVSKNGRSGWRCHSRYYSGKRGTDGPWTGIGLALTDEGRELFEGVQIGFKRRTGKNLSQCSD